MTLAALASRLDSIANGEASRAAAERIAAALEAKARDALGSHVKTGNAEASLRVLSTDRNVSIAAPAYLKFHSWWPFREGMPADEQTNAAKVLGDEVGRRLRG